MPALFRTPRCGFAVLVLLAAVAAQPAYADDTQQQLPQNAVIKLADWNAATEVLVELGDNNYEPADLVFKTGKPYKLILRNIGQQAHDMVGGSFFADDVIALRMVNTRVGRITADQISSVYIRPKQEAEIWFVPVKPGTYSFFCSIPGHRESGMEGGVVIEP